MTRTARTISPGRRALPTVGMLIVAGVLQGCGGAPSGAASQVVAVPSEQIRVSGAFGNTSDAFWTTVMCSAKQRAKERGVKLTVYESKGAGPEELKNIEETLKSDAQGLILNTFALDQKKGPVAVAEKMSKGIPVVTANDLQPATQYQSVNVNQDGSIVVNRALQEVGTTGLVYVLGGLSSWPVMMASRYQPTLDAIRAKAPAVRILPVEYSEFSPDLAEKLLRQAITKHPGLTMIIASSGPESEAAVKVLRDTGRKGKIKLLGFDAVPNAVSGLRDGTAFALGSQPALDIGAAQVDSVADYLTANPDGGAVTGTEKRLFPMVLLTRENLNDPASAGSVYSATCAL